jgi:hypothetical protein
MANPSCAEARWLRVTCGTLSRTHSPRLGADSRVPLRPSIRAAFLAVLFILVTGRDSAFFSCAALGSVQVRMFRQVEFGDYGVMKILILDNDSCMHSENIMTEASRQLLSKQLARVIAINLMCLVVFVAFCAIMTFGSPSLLLTYWNEHRAASVVVIMIAIVSIPSAIELTVSRLGFWQH